MRLDAEQCGTLLGSVAWVMGALAILEDRGHAAGDESLHEKADALMPKLERLVSELGGVRAAAGGKNDGSNRRSIHGSATVARTWCRGWLP